MTDTDLRDNLAAIATQVRPVDLYARSLSRSRQLRNRRLATGVASAVAVLALAGVVSAQLLPNVLATPLPPAHPGPADTFMIGTDVTEDLKSATLTVPPWPPAGEGCPVGVMRVDSTFAGPDEPSVMIIAIRATLDGDPAVVVTIMCNRPALDLSRPMTQVVAYRMGADNTYELMGTVIRTDDEIDNLFSGVSARTPEEIQVNVQHRIVDANPAPEFSTISQTRTFMWTGAAFAQTSGPVTFAVSAERQAAVTTTTTDLTFGKPDAKGCRTGTMKVTVRNTGTAPAIDLSAVVAFPKEDVWAQDVPQAGCEHQTMQAADSALAVIPTVPAGGTVTTTIRIVVQGPARPSTIDDPANVVQLHTRNEYGEQYFPATQQFTVTYA